jgi:hypothetical protein
MIYGEKYIWVAKWKHINVPYLYEIWWSVYISDNKDLSDSYSIGNEFAAADEKIATDRMLEVIRNQKQYSFIAVEHPMKLVEIKEEEKETYLL